MDRSVTAALAEVHKVFAARRRPHSVPHCPMCYRDEEAADFLSRPASAMSAEDLRPILWDGYMCWGTWREVAHYVPRLLHLYALNELPDDEEFYGRLLIPARPELGVFDYNIGEKMLPEERHSIFECVQEIVLSRLGQPHEYDQGWFLTEAMSFLAAFDVPLRPFLDRLVSSTSAHVCANVCVFMAHQVWEPQIAENRLLKAVNPFPENQAALDDFLAPRNVAAFLLEHAADVSIFGAEIEAYIGCAFDWAMQGQPG